jgi:hypothetical protein
LFFFIFELLIVKEISQHKVGVINSGNPYITV